MSSSLVELSIIPHPIVFPYFFALLIEEGLLSLLPILYSFAFSWVYLSSSPLPFTSLLSLAIVKSPQTTSLPSCISFSLG